MADDFETQMISEIQAWIDEFADRVFAHSQDNLVKQGKVDTGNLLKHGNVNRGVLSAEIVYAAPYAEAVEYGRSPGTMPPPQALIKWARRKLGLNDKEAKRAAWAIASAIKKRGIAASPYLEPAITMAEHDMKVRI